MSRDFDELDAEMLDLERELHRELQDLPDSDREELQRQPHLAYIVLYTSDTEELADFYEGVFGFSRRYESSSAIELAAGMMVLAIADEGELLETVGLETLPRPHEGRSSHSVMVEDVDGCYAAAIELGAHSIRAPHDTEWGMRSCWVRDPAGHLLEIGRVMR
jgi:uncharacterized protein